MRTRMGKKKKHKWHKVNEFSEKCACGAERIRTRGDEFAKYKMPDGLVYDHAPECTRGDGK